MKINRIKELILILNNARNAYYNHNEIIPNYEYDKLYDELQKLELETQTFMSNSPTQNVGYKVKSQLKQVKLKYKLLSLDKTKKINDLYKFMNNKKCLLGSKLDGLTTSLFYEDGKLVLATTRGNGEIGEDITHNITSFLNVPTTIPYKNKLNVVGESIISYSNFDKINENLEEKYKNPRNLVSGSARHLNSKVCKNRNVEFYVFGVNEGFSEINSKDEKFNMIKQLGFDVYDYECISQEDNLQELINKLAKNNKDIPIDGMVITYDDIKYSDSLGYTNHHFRSGLAYKFEDIPEYTILRDIKVDIGKSGQVSYTAIFDSVEIDGTDVSRATLHNYDYIKNLELGIGDKIGVIKANLIIPAVVENETRSNTYSKALRCPICGSNLVHDGVHQFCKNSECSKQVLGKLVHFCSRNAMDIRGLSEETLKAIISLKFNDKISVLNTLSDIYNIPKNKETLYELDRFGKKKVDNICKAIEESKNRNLNNFIYGLSIPQCGKTASKKIASYYKNIDNLLEAELLDLTNLVGDSVGNSVYKYLQNEDFRVKEIALFKSHGLKMIQPQEETSNKLEGLNFVITGKVEIFKNRKEIQNKIESLGGKVNGSVSKNTNYLLNNDKESSSSKNKKAKELGVEMISEKDFINMIK